MHTSFTGCFADGTERSTYKSLVKVSFSVPFARALQPSALGADGVVGIVGQNVSLEVLHDPRRCFVSLLMMIVVGLGVPSH